MITLNIVNFSISHVYKDGLVSFKFLLNYLGEVNVLLHSGNGSISFWHLISLLILPIVTFVFMSLWLRKIFPHTLTEETRLRLVGEKMLSLDKIKGSKLFKMIRHLLHTNTVGSLIRQRAIVLGLACFCLASCLELSSKNILGSNIVYRMISNEVRHYFFKKNISLFFKTNQVNKSSYPDQSHFESLGYKFNLEGYPAVKTTPNPQNTLKQKPNLVFIILESLAAKDTALQDYISTPGINVTPFLNSLLSKSVVFAPFFSNADYTAGAEVAIFCSMHDSLRYSVANGSILRDLTNTKLLCLPKILAERGYATSFFHSYTTTFDNKDQFFPLNGVQEIIDRDHPELKYLKRVSFGLMSDEELFLYGVKHLNQSKKPFFASFLTVDNHTPFVMHDPSKKKHFTDQKKYNRYLNTVKETDDALRSFFCEASKQAWYDNTIFVITSDNGVLLAEKDIKNINWEYFFKIWHLVPFMIYSPAQKFNLKPRRIFLKAASHIDVTPTILDMLGLELTNPFVGESLFSKKRRGYTLIYDWFDNYYRLSWPALYHNTDNQMHDLIREEKINSKKLSQYHRWVTQSRDFFNYLTFTDQIWTDPRSGNLPTKSNATSKNKKR